jgi:hypothetical protein
MAVTGKFTVTVWAHTIEQVERVVIAVNEMTARWPDVPVVNAFALELRETHDNITENEESVDG